MRTLNYRFIIIVIALFTVVLLHTSCEKYVKNGEMEGGVALTFDDNYIDDWYTYLPLLDSFGAKATFYISAYSDLSAQQKQRLKIIQQHGNEIAFHTAHHVNMVQYLKTKSLRQLMKTEIFNGLDSMAKDGLYPKNFAYPFGQHNEILDAALIKVFRSIRVLNGTKDYTHSVCKARGKSYFSGLGIDAGSRSESVIGTMLENAKNHNNCIILVGHRIESQHRPNLPAAKLRFVLQKAKDMGLRFYTIEELSR